MSGTNRLRDRRILRPSHAVLHGGLFVFVVIFLSVRDILASPDYSHCSSGSVLSNVPRKSIVPNQFQKICPGRDDNVPFGNPICGDGTSFNFYFSRPPQTHEDSRADKIIIEFQGGGACWDAETCNMAGDYLTFPEKFDNFMGYGCSEINVAVSDGDYNNNFPISMLCSRDSLGGVDLTSYNTIVVPYCTQDVHIGDATKYYSGDDDDAFTMVHHRGAHNMYQTLRWVYRNFKNPSQIILTGCSAGGTAVPIAYRLLSNHYNSITKGGFRAVHLHVLADSPVYLTPSYFMQTSFPNWNPTAMMKLLGFNFKKYMYDENYSTKLWDFIISRGSNNDKWGLVSHAVDPVSIYYWQMMGGNYDGNYENYDDDSLSSWYGDFAQSLSTLQKKHRNLKTFFMSNEEGHCSFGLYYALQYNGFSDWIAPMLAERSVLGKDRASSLLFFSSLLLACGMLGLGFRSREAVAGSLSFRTQESVDSSMLLHKAEKNGIDMPALAKYPLTIAYFAFVMFYFVTMVLVGGFTHPLNNPSLGPSANVLSSFGINNPTLIVYNMEFWRLLTSSFLCSGFNTLLMVSICLWRNIRKIEQFLENPFHFLIICFTIILGSNLAYAWTSSGATCSSVAFVLGLQTFSIRMATYLEGPDTYRTSWPGTLLPFLIASLLFPFNSWVVMIAAMLIGYFVVPSIFHWRSARENQKTNLNHRRCTSLAAAYSILFLLLVVRVRRPDRTYLYPYRTGCNLVYTTDVNDIIGAYENADGGRRLGDDEGQNDNYNMCAQVCIPEIAYLPVMYGINSAANTYVDLSLERGICEENGYQDLYVIKTFNYASITLDAEVYYKSDYYNE
mmetsp:Transcript_884/g.1944  ORF Transcript_884/g.1944 Transcript_884/m.1944 type:complete len:839 (-) Transcript_884:69-2585(-)